MKRAVHGISHLVDYSQLYRHVYEVLGITKTDVSKAVNIDHKSLWNTIHDGMPLNEPTINKLCYVLNIDQKDKHRYFACPVYPND
jgi:predicted transcriptional regulator